jgi:hypothetical protein
MSGNFRIGGAVPGKAQEERQRGTGRKETLAHFKRGRGTGELVSGVFTALEPLSPGTAWVDFEGDKLLALLPEAWAELARRIFEGRGAGARPSGVGEGDFPLQPGSRCFFVLEELEPELVLRMLKPAEQASGETEKPALFEALLESTGAIPPAQLISRYAGLCARLDGLLQKRLWPDRVFPCRDAYVDYIQREEEALDIYARLTLYRAAVVRGLRERGLGDLLYLPWLNPKARGIHMAILTEKRSGASGGCPAFILQAAHPSGQRVEIRGEPGRQKPEERFTVRTGRPLEREDLFSILLDMYPREQRGGFSLRA